MSKIDKISEIPIIWTGGSPDCVRNKLIENLCRTKIISKIKNIDNKILENKEISQVISLEELEGDIPISSYMKIRITLLGIFSDHLHVDACLTT